MLQSYTISEERFFPQLPLHFCYCCIFMIRTTITVILFFVIISVVIIIIIVNFVQSNGKTLEALECDAFGGSEKQSIVFIQYMFYTD